MRTAFRGLGLALLLLAHSAPVDARHGVGAPIDARRATPGLHLALLEQPAAGPPTAAPTYRLVATGVPRGVLFGIWTKQFGQAFEPVASGFRVNAAGVLEAIDDEGRARPLDEVVLGPGPYPPGAAWDVALVSADHAVQALTRVTPRPIAARSGACAVALELASRRGDRYLVTTQGFAPGEAVVVELQVATGVSRKQVFVPPDRRLPLDVINHGPATADLRARYTVRGAACEVAVDYTWGEPVPAQSARSAKSGVLR